MEDNEDQDFVAAEHDHLVSAITKLDKTQHITEPTRSEPTNLNSEFNLIKRSNKLKLTNVVKVLQDTSHNVLIGKKLKESQNFTKVLPKPLEKPQAERIKRSTGYDQTKHKLGRWNPVVARNRTVDFVSFPIKTTSNKLQPTGDFLSKLKLKSPLERELEEVDPPPEPEVNDDEEQTYPMNYQDMLEHRQQLAKIRAKQSYTAAKAKRQSKIKSKKYHRILKKERLKQQIKEFEELQTKNPEEALKKLEELEKARALERHTLRHKNTGKWAKSKLVRAKFDKDVRQQLSEQLLESKSLTQKVQKIDSTDDEADEPEVTENICIPDMTLAQDPINGWMSKKSETNIDAAFDFGYKKYLKDRMYKRKEESESESDQDDSKNNKLDLSLSVLKESVKKLENIATSTDNYCIQKQENEESKTSERSNNNINMTKKVVTKVSKNILNKPNKELVATSFWKVDDVDISSKSVSDTETISEAFDNLDDKIAGKVARKLRKLRKEVKKLENESEKGNKIQAEKTDEVDDLEYLKLKTQKLKPIIDEELLETHKNINEGDKETPTKSLKIDTSLKEDKYSIEDVDTNKFKKRQPKYLKSIISNEQNDFDELDEDDEQVVPKVNFDEVFEEDDLVTSFRKEKEDEINSDLPKDTNSTLPGWGTWGGQGIKVRKRRNNRFIAKPAPKMPRRDDNKGDIIIHETKNPKLVSHKISDVPFPFNSVKEYEASVRTPIGNTFIPETAHKKLIRPNVITKAGSVIEPMDEDELLVKRNRTFKNESVIKLLAK